jgi:hypothetical protein
MAMSLFSFIVGTKCWTASPSVMSTNPFEPPKEVNAALAAPTSFARVLLHVLLRVVAVVCGMVATFVLLVGTVALVTPGADIIGSIFDWLVLCVSPAVGGFVIGVSLWLQRPWLFFLGMLGLLPFFCLLLYAAVFFE